MLACAWQAANDKARELGWLAEPKPARRPQVEGSKQGDDKPIGKKPREGDGYQSNKHGTLPVPLVCPIDIRCVRHTLWTSDIIPKLGILGFATVVGSDRLMIGVP
jgi:hypothetical protein